jgi:hypothetical protein
MKDVKVLSANITREDEKQRCGDYRTTMTQPGLLEAGNCTA